jgi:hypothetical protein
VEKGVIDGIEELFIHPGHFPHELESIVIEVSDPLEEIAPGKDCPDRPIVGEKRGGSLDRREDEVAKNAGILGKEFGFVPPLPGELLNEALPLLAPFLMLRASVGGIDGIFQF